MKKMLRKINKDSFIALLHPRTGSLRILQSLNKHLHTPMWLFWLLLVVLMLRIPTFFEPYSYGDEMIYLTLGEAVRRGIPLYKQIHDNKPPLLYITAAVAGSLFWFRAILAIWHLVTVFVFWKLSEKLFPKKGRLQKISTVIFALLTTIPLFEGNIANAELFMIGPIILAFWMLLSKKLTPKNLLMSGFLFSVATLFKVPAAFDIPAIIFFWLATTKLTVDNVKKIVVNTIYVSLGFLIPIGLTFVWYYLRGALNEYLVAAFLQNVGYLSSFRPDQVRDPFLARNAPLLLRAGIVAVGMLILYIKRRSLSKPFLFTTAWLLLTLFAVTLSERPYPHYLIQSVAPIAILFAMLFALKTREQVLAIIPLALTFFVPVYFNFWYYPTTPYYTRFIRFATGQISKEEYIDSFGSNVSRGYEIADFVKRSTKQGEKIYVWGDTALIYALSRRLAPTKYIADYHIKDFSNLDATIEMLEKDMPELVIIMPNAEPFPQLRQFVRDNYGLTQEFDGAEVWKLLKPSLRSRLSS